MKPLTRATDQRRSLGKCRGFFVGPGFERSRLAAASAENRVPSGRRVARHVGSSPAPAPSLRVGDRLRDRRHDSARVDARVAYSCPHPRARPPSLSHPIHLGKAGQWAPWISAQTTQKERRRGPEVRGAVLSSWAARRESRALKTRSGPSPSRRGCRGRRAPAWCRRAADDRTPRPDGRRSRSTGRA